ncbi:MAG: hypothetical protein ACLRPC_00210 [Streptococcus sp.]
MQASNEQKQERTEKMIVVKKSPKWWATAAATGGLIVGMTSGFGLGMLATANTTPQRQQATVATQNGNQPAQNPQGQNSQEIVRDRMDILTHKVLMAKMVDQGKAK